MLFHFQGSCFAPDMARKLRDLAKKALDRAEVLKAAEHEKKDGGEHSLDLPEPPIDGTILSSSSL